MDPVQELRDERARVLDAIDDIIRSAAENGWTDDERARHDELVAQLEGEDGLDVQIARAETELSDVSRNEAAQLRRSRYATVGVNTISRAPAAAGSSLDELLWATDETVRAGTLNRAGNVVGHHNATAAVDQVIVRSRDGEFTPAPRIADLHPEDRRRGRRRR